MARAGYVCTELRKNCEYSYCRPNARCGQLCSLFHGVLHECAMVSVKAYRENKHVLVRAHLKIVLEHTLNTHTHTKKNEIFPVYAYIQVVLKHTLKHTKKQKTFPRLFLQAYCTVVFTQTSDTTTKSDPKTTNNKKHS